MKGPWTAAQRRSLYTAVYTAGILGSLGSLGGPWGAWGDPGAQKIWERYPPLCACTTAGLGLLG